MYGEYLLKIRPEGASLIGSSVRESVPVFVPAIADSSIGIGLLMARREGIRVDVDQISDVDDIARIVAGSKKTGVIYIGGGVPKNFIQQTQVIASIYGSRQEGHAYAIQYTTDAPHWGGLSGCTFEEAIELGERVCPYTEGTVFL